METASTVFQDELRQAAFELGFPLFGVVKAQEAEGFDRLREWLDRGYQGTMAYFSKRLSAYQHPSSLLDGVRTLVMLGIPYTPARRLRPVDTEDRAELGTGKVAAYAVGQRDYHDVIHERLKELAHWLLRRYPQASVRGVVDTAPLLEREFAARAGLGWIGKNTLLLHRQAGSYFFLAALLTDIEIASLPSLATDHCGTCTACLDACPTHAFPAPRVLDASRCISYLTIEHRGTIPVELRGAIGDWVFGCDVCQQVCPWNRMALPSDESDFQPQSDLQALELHTLLAQSESEFRQRYKKTPLWRAKRKGMLRNALIVLGNQRREGSLAWIAPFLEDEEIALRQTAAWALGRIGGDSSRRLLRDRLSREESDEVRREIVDALEATALG